jgi:hypothetical protein
MAQIADRAGVDIVSVGDSVGVNLWGRDNPLEVTLEEMLVVCKAVRRGTRRAMVSCDFPFGPLQEGTQSAVNAAIRIVKEAGADMVKLDGAADFPDAVRAIARAGIPVFAQFCITPQTALKYGIEYSAQSSAQVPKEMAAQLVEQARLLERQAQRCSISPTPTCNRPRGGARHIHSVIGGSAAVRGTCACASRKPSATPKWIDSKSNLRQRRADEPRRFTALVDDVRPGGRSRVDRHALRSSAERICLPRTGHLRSRPAR